MTTTTESGASPAGPHSTDRGARDRDATGPAAGPVSGPPARGGLRLLRGRPHDPRWVRPSLLGLLVATAVTYLWGLGASGWANSFYAAAVQAGTRSGTAWLFGALDAPGLITVDKPPASLWVMALSGRILGFSSWSMLAPQALMGVASVGLLHLTVRRWSGPRTALAAAALLAFTPVAVLMFRFNNPDAMLVLTMVAAAYTTTRAIDAAGRRAGTWWLVATGVLVGLGFLTKQLQVLLVVPALASAVLVVAPSRLRRRVGDLLAGGLGMIVSAGWYVALVELWPTSARPYIGGSTTNSLLELALGYNGLSRITGGEGVGAGPGPGGGPGGAPGGGPGGFGGEAGPWRLFTQEFSGNASWLLPAAVLMLVAGLWFTRRAPRTDRSRALLLLGGLWTFVHVLVFSAMSGIIHPYYTVALAPGVAITAATGASILWRRRAQPAARVVLAVAVLGTGVWGAVVLTQQQWMPVLGWVFAAVAGLAAVALVLPAAVRGRVRGLGVLTVTLALVGALGASTAYAGVTAATPHQGSIVSAGPQGTGVPGGHGGGPTGGGPTGGGAPDDDAVPRMPGAATGATTSPELTELLRQAGTRWSAATTGANSAAPLALASGTSVMAMGGFMGSDPAPTLAQFQQHVAEGQVRYVVEGGGGPGAGGAPGADGGSRGGPANRGTSAEILAWVAAHFTAVDVDGTTVYDLARPL